MPFEEKAFIFSCASKKCRPALLAHILRSCGKIYSRSLTTLILITRTCLFFLFFFLVVKDSFPPLTILIVGYRAGSFFTALSHFIYRFYQNITVALISESGNQSARLHQSAEYILQLYFELGSPSTDLR